jgi:hypothetical protein
MANASVTINPLPERNSALLTTFGGSGLAVVNIKWITADSYFIVPQDDSRVYLAFSINNAFVPIQVSPGPYSFPFGYWLQSAEATLEFGGNVVKELITCAWYLQTTAAGNINVISIRR